MPRKPTIIIELTKEEKRAVQKAARNAKVTVQEFAHEKVMRGIMVDTGKIAVGSTSIEIPKPVAEALAAARSEVEAFKAALEETMPRSDMPKEWLPQAPTVERPDPGHFENGVWVAD